MKDCIQIGALFKCQNVITGVETTHTHAHTQLAYQKVLSLFTYNHKQI